MMDLASHGPDTFVGTGPTYPWGGLFGGQIVAQSLRAACATVSEDFRPHSLHAYFIRKGDASEPIRFEVDRVRDGRSFVTRSVTARQSSGVILQMSASLQRHHVTAQVQTATPPAVPAPDELAENSWSPMFQRRLIERDDQAAAWLRLPVEDPDDPVVAACALAFLSDELATDAVHGLHHRSLPPGEPRWGGISLDHAIWFQAPITGGGWQLHTYRADGLLPPRGLAVGHIFSAAGDHLATVAQEVLLRPRG